MSMTGPSTHTVVVQADYVCMEVKTQENLISLLRLDRLVSDVQETIAAITHLSVRKLTTTVFYLV